jgi:CPA2 family monovalent cation:H+ antiporter-2
LEAHGITAHNLLLAIGLVLSVAAVTTVLFQRLRQPVVLGYLVAGVLVGPHVAFPLFAEPTVIHSLSELGVILLMFGLGLEFRLSKLVELAPTAGITSLVQASLMIWLGFAIGRAFGWTTVECLFSGAMLAISSTTIIAKAFDEQGVRGRMRDLVVGILIVEDLIAVLLLAVLTAVGTGSGLSAGAIALTTGRLAAFLVGLVVVGLITVPRAMRAVVSLGRAETTLVASIGMCFAIALLAQWFGYSVALGAFIAGSLVAESGEGEHVGHLIAPVRDMFAAIFFVSVGMVIDPGLIPANAGAIAALTAAVIFGNMVGVGVGAFLTGNGTRTSVQAGMSLTQIGEFSFIIAGLGITLGATRDFLYPIAVAVSAITTLSTPWLIRWSGPAASFVDRKLPKPIQTFVTLYASWIERLRTAPREASARASTRRTIALLLGDMGLFVGIVIGASLVREQAAGVIAELSGLARSTASALFTTGAALVCLPFLLGIVGLARSLGRALAERAFPARAENELDLAAAPRRALRVSLELAIVLLVALPLLAITQPFIGGFVAVLAAASLFAVGISFWRSATSLAVHVRAGAQMIAEALATQSARGTHGGPERALDTVEGLVPGLGELVPLQIDGSSGAVGRTLAELDLRGQTGATVLAIQRGSNSVSFPAAREVLQAGDVLALAGTEEAVAAARGLLRAARESV